MFAMFEKRAFARRIGLALGLVCIFASAATAADPQPKSEREKMDDQVFGRLAKAWTSFYDGKNEEAVKQAEPLLKLSAKRYRWVAAEAAHIQARAYWAHGGRRGQAKAGQLWKRLERIDTSNVTKVRLKIAQALELEAAASASSGQASEDAKRNQAIALLEQIRKDRQSNTAAPEAGIDLARLYVQARRFDDAEKTLKFVIAFLGDKRTLIRMELPDEAMVQPYIKAAKGALARLKYERDAGREEFEAAEKLRKQEKWLQAARAYQVITKDFSATDYAPRSELHIGDCLLGHGRADRAIRQWEDFIASAPAGPWRGQAYVGLIDTLLETKLDLPLAGKYAESAQAALPKALAEEQARAKDNSSPLVPSWKNAAFDLHIRVGMVNFCRGKTDLAADAFAQARQRTTDKITIDRLDALIAATRTGRPLIPADCQSANRNSQSTIALPLSMGMIYHLVGRYEKALDCFTRVTGTTAQKGQPAQRAMPGATSAQRAFATFGRGIVAQAQGQLDQANEHLKASMETHPAGSWHDETLYRLGTITEQQAEATHAKPADKDATPAGKLTAKQRKAKEKAEQERLAALAKAKGQALPYWQKLIDRYPRSPRVEQALYRKGVLQYELAEVAPAEKSLKMFEIALDSLDQFCEAYPKSLWAGDAYVRQVSVATEHLFDLKLSQAIAPQAAQWAKAATEGGKADSPALPPWAMAERRQGESQIGHTAQDCLLQAGLIAYLSGQFDQAVEWIDTSGPKAPKEGYAEKPDLESIGLYYILKAIRSKKSLTDKQALDAANTDEQRLVLQLGDLYMESVRPDRAEAIFTRIIDRDPRLGQMPPALEGYAMLQIATALDRQEGRRAEALDTLKKIAAKRELQGTYWGGCGLFRLALFTYNQTQDAKQSLPLYQQMLTQYPNHELAELAHLYLCLDAIQLKDNSLAEKAGQTFLEKYPKSEYRAVLQDRLSRLVK